MEEVWKKVKEYGNKYSISNFGNIRNDAKGGRHLKQHIDQYGYMKVSLTDKKSYHVLVHRLVARYFLLDGKDTQLQVNHKDGVKTNNKIGNLEFVTNLENTRHAWATGLVTLEHYANKNIGSESGMAKVNEEKVKEIRELFKKGHSYKELALQFGIDRSNICRIVNNKTWKHVKG